MYEAHYVTRGRATVPAATEPHTLPHPSTQCCPSLRATSRDLRRAGAGRRSQVALAVQRRGEGGVVERAGHGARAGVGGHSADAVLRLVRRQLPPQLLRQDVRLQET